MNLNYAADRKDHYHTDKFYTVIREDGAEFDLPGNLINDHIKRGFTLKRGPYVSIEDAEATKTAYVPDEVTIEEVTIDVEPEVKPEPIAETVVLDEEDNILSGLEKLTRPQLMTLAKEQGHKVAITDKKTDLIEKLLK